MKPVWVTIIDPSADDIGTWGMNVPGGMVLKTAFGMVFINGSKIESIAPDRGYRFVSTATEELQKVVQPLQELMQEFLKANNIIDPPKSS